jgi:hypothetical protein
LDAINISNPYYPTSIGHLNLTGNCISIAVTDTIAFIGTEANGLHAVNIKLPSSMWKWSTESSEPSFIDLKIDTLGAYDSIYVVAAGGNEGLIMINVSNPNAMYYFTSYMPLTGNVNSIALHNNRAYLANRTAGLTVVDYSNRWSLFESGGFSTTDALGVCYNNSKVYIADASQGLIVVDVTGNPTLTDSFATGGVCADVVINPITNYIYTSVSGSGIFVFEYSL